MYISTWTTCCQNIENYCHWFIVIFTDNVVRHKKLWSYFPVNLLKEIYQLSLTWLYITHNINILIIWVKALLGNKLNDCYFDTLFFGFQVLFVQSLFEFKWRNWNISLTEATLFDYIYFEDVLWNSCQLSLFFLFGEQCLIWRFHFDCFLILN